MGRPARARANTVSQGCRSTRFMGQKIRIEEPGCSLAGWPLCASVPSSVEWG